MSEFVSTFWNTKTQYNGRSRTSKVSSGQIAYKKKGQAWDFVNANIQNDFSVTAFPGSIQIPTNAQGWLDLSFEGEYSAKRQVNEGVWSNSEDAFELRMQTNCPTNSLGIIHPSKPWQVIYYDAFGQGANLIYGVWHGRTSRVEHVIEITEMPPGNSEFLTYEFFIQSNDATTFIGAGHSQRPWAGNSGDAADVEGFDVFLAKGGDHNTLRGAVLGKPVCWWTNLDGSLTKKNVKINFQIQPDGITVKATKYVKRSDIAEALAQGSVYRADATFYPDPSPESTSVDGRVNCDTSNQSWSTKIAAAGTSSTDNASPTYLALTPSVSSNLFNEFWYSIFLFDTSSIGSGQSVSAATLDLFIDNDFPANDDLGIDWNIYEETIASNTAIASTDYDGETPSTPLTDTPRAVIDESSTAQYVTQTFNSDGRTAIAMEGVSKFCMNLVEARENGTAGDPGWSGTGTRENRLSIRSAEYSGTSSDPLLTVTYSAASTGSPWNYYANQQGAI